MAVYDRVSLFPSSSNLADVFPGKYSPHKSMAIKAGPFTKILCSQRLESVGVSLRRGSGTMGQAAAVVMTLPRFDGCGG